MASMERMEEPETFSPEDNSRADIIVKEEPEDRVLREIRKYKIPKLNAAQRERLFTLLANLVGNSTESPSTQQETLGRILDILNNLPSRKSWFRDLVRALRQTGDTFFKQLAVDLENEFQESRRDMDEGEWESSGSEDIDGDENIGLKIPPCSESFYREHSTDFEKNYKNTSSPRGRVLVINNKKFDGKKDRRGTEHDVAMLEKLFTGLHYQVVVKHDLKAQAIEDALREESQNPVHESLDSFVCVILSHGNIGIVYGTDFKFVKYQEIFSFFNNKSCPGLRGKPKLFFIQACQGKKRDEGAICTDEGESEEEEETDSPGATKMVCVDAEAYGNDIRPTESDRLVAKATTEEYVSYRDAKKGTWFIQAIVDVFRQRSCQEDVVSMFTQVNSHVSRLSTPKNQKQMSELTHTLCKKMYFFPGNGKGKLVAPPRDLSSMMEDMRWKKSKFGSVNTLSINPEVLTPRAYQEELAQPAMDGLNCIIYAPPNSGKTLVALMIAKNHLEKRCASKMTAATSGRGDEDDTQLKTAASSLGNTVPKVLDNDDDDVTRLKTPVNTSSVTSCHTAPAVLGSNSVDEVTQLKTVVDTQSSKLPKVAFVTRRFALLQQTFKHFKKYMPLWSIGKRSGASNSNVPLSVLVQRKDIIIVVDNILKNSLESEDVSIMDFSLIIFDECHHCKADNDHPYNQIMSFYIEQKLKLGKTGEGKLPQIVGLTASPGGGKRPVAESVAHHILKLCANLDARRIITVKYNLDELNQMKLEPIDQVCIEVEERENPFNDLLASMMGEIESRIQVSTASTKGTQEYMSFVEEKKKAFLEDDGPNTGDCLLCLEHLLEYNSAMEFCSSMRMEDGLKALEDFYNEMERKKRQSGFGTMERRLLKLFKDNVPQLISFASSERTPPKLELLKEQVLTEQRKQEENSLPFRAMIFVKTKKTAEAMKRWINNATDLHHLNADVFMGIKSSEKGGMSPETQAAVLKKFESGETKVLISTSVGGEGIHESNCGMVVIYDHMFDDIYSIQSRGRARTTKSTIAVIGAANTTAKHEVNVLLEQLTKMAVASIQQIPPDQMLQIVEDFQREDAYRRKQKREMMEEQKKINRTDDVTLICKGLCGRRVCNLSDIRTIGCSYVNPDPDFASNFVLFRDHHNSQQRALGIKKIYCKVCEQDWGNTLKGYPCLKISAFYTEERGVKQQRKKWSKVPYSVNKLYADA